MFEPVLKMPVATERSFAETFRHTRIAAVISGFTQAKRKARYAETSTVRIARATLPPAPEQTEPHTLFGPIS